MNRSIAITAVAVGAGLAALAFAGLPRLQAEEPSSVGAFSADQEAAIRAMIADYIAANPDALVAALDSYAESEERQKAEAMNEAQREALPFLVSDDGAFAAGPDVENATVAVVEFFDYHCGFCKRANGMVRALTADDPAVKVVFRELPILKEESGIAARFALAAREQDRYLDLHFAMMEERGTLTEARILEIATDAKLDVARLKRDADDSTVKAQIARNYQVAGDIGVDYTPGFLVAAVNGSFVQVIPGFRPDDIKAAIREAKKSAG